MNDHSVSDDLQRATRKMWDEINDTIFTMKCGYSIA